MRVNLKNNPTPEQIIADIEKRLREPSANSYRANAFKHFGADQLSVALTFEICKRLAHAALVFEICTDGSLFLPNRENQIRCLAAALKYARAVLN